MMLGVLSLGEDKPRALVGQSVVLNWLEEFVGHQWLYEHISALNTYAYHTLKDVPGLTMLTPQPGMSGLITFQARRS